ncbi:MAG: SpoIID/LytB domain-containing protein [Tissierellia bacterium]|nr:SpoIID/LytB domain-containing protein [Tissierellia bacterium]
MKKILMILCLLLAFSVLPVRLLAMENMPYAQLNIQIANGDHTEYQLTCNSGFVVKNQFQVLVEIPYEKIQIGYSNGLCIKANGETYGPYMDVVLFSRNDTDDIIYQGRAYDGGFYIVQNGSQHLINRVPLEEYIYSVVAGEVGSTFEMEAMKAQAIAARSYALTNMKKYVDEGYDLKSSVSSQIYYGKEKVDEKVISAVNGTRGEFLYFNDEIVHATYSSSNGGVMASAEEAWGKDVAYLVSKMDPYSTNTPKVHWTYAVTKEQLEDKLKDVLKGKTLQSIQLKSNTFGRVQSVVLETTAGTEEISGNKFRTYLGGLNIKSTFFHLRDEIVETSSESHEKNVEIKTYYTDKGNLTVDLFAVENTSIEDNIIKKSVGDQFVFEGKGFGHGVGMSQYGANEMAKLGKDYKEILSFYYEGAEIKKLYD